LLVALAGQVANSAHDALLGRYHLQMLELANGQTLSKLLQERAERLLADWPESSIALIKTVYEGALAVTDPPGAAIGGDLLGQPAKKEGVEDFLWGMAMLPEFQLIY